MTDAGKEVAARFCAARASLSPEQRWAVDLYEEAKNSRHFSNAPITTRMERLFEREAAAQSNGH